MIGVKNISYIITGLIVSMYFFPFGFTFLPEITNSKNLCGFMGVILALFDGLKVREIRVNKIMLGAIFIVIIYSIIGYISIDINNSFDKSYANYFVSFSIWTFGAYFACSVINKVHGVVNIRLVGIYLAAVGLSQCILALLNNTFPFFKVLVDTYIEQGSGFLDGIGRWYGIGAALDPAGVRFCLILILIAGIVVHDKIVRESKKTLIFLLTQDSTGPKEKELFSEQNAKFLIARLRTLQRLGAFNETLNLIQQIPEKQQTEETTAK